MSSRKPHRACAREYASTDVPAVVAEVGCGASRSRESHGTWHAAPTMRAWRVCPRAPQWRRALYVTGGSSPRGLGYETLQLRPAPFLPNCIPPPHTYTTHHRITWEVARGTRDARAAGVRARASRWRRAPYVTGGSSPRGLGDKTLQLRPFFPIAYHHHTPPPRRSFEGDAARGNGGDPVGDVDASGALPTRGGRTARG